MTYRSKPQREGYTLTEEGENLYSDWLDLGGCCCPTGCAPCSSCVSDGNPISLEEGDEYWEPTPEYKKEIRIGDTVICNTDLFVAPVKGKEYIVEDLFELQCGSYPTVIRILGTYNNYPIKYFNLKEVKMARDKIVNKSSVKDPPEFKVGKWYKCTDSIGSSILECGKYYQIDGFRETRLSSELILKGCDISYNNFRFDVNSECDYNPDSRGTPENIIKASNHCVGVDRGTQLYYDSTGAVIVPKECEGIDLSKYPVRFKGVINSETVLATISNSINQQEESKMSNANNRRVLTVQVFDLDPALDVELSLVHVFKDVVTEDTNEVTLTELLHTGQLVEPLALHNKKRVAQDNKDILSRTGKKVKLEPAKIKNLSFKYV